MKTKFTWKEADKINWLSERGREELSLNERQLQWLFGYARPRVNLMKRYLVPNPSLNQGKRAYTTWKRCTVNQQVVEADRVALLKECEDDVVQALFKLKGKAEATSARATMAGYGATPYELCKLGLIHPMQQSLLERDPLQVLNYANPISQIAAPVALLTKETT